MAGSQKTREVQTEASRGRLVAATVRDAIRETERAICGPAVVGSVAEAEGLALTGVAAATWIESHDLTASGGVTPTVREPWVHHRTGRPATEPAGVAPFELVASEAQEAVDHCLAAHRLARAAGAPVVCVVDPRALDRLSFVRLPETADLGPRPATPAVDLPQLAERTLGSEGILPAHRAEDADLLLIAAGEDRLRAARLSDRLRRAGVACGVIGVALVRPFPADRLRELVARRRTIAIGTLGEPVTRALGAGQCVHVEPTAAGEIALPVSLLDEIGIESLPDEAPDGAGDGLSPIAIAIDPPDATGERILLDTATCIARMGRIEMVRRFVRAGDSMTLVLGRDAWNDGERLDVGVLLHPSATDGREVENVLGRLDESSTLWIVTEDADPAAMWSALGPFRQAWIKRRRPRLLHTTPSSDLPDLVASSVDAGWLERLRDGNGPTSRQAPLRELPPVLDLAAFETESGADDARGLRPTDLPSYPPFDAGRERERSAEALRRFHLTGRPETAESLTCEGPLVTLAGREIAATGGPWDHYPFVLRAGEDSSEEGLPFLDWAKRSIESASSASGAQTAILGRAVHIIPHVANRLLRGRIDRPSAAGLLDEVLRELPGELDLSAAGQAELEREVAGIGPSLPQGGHPVAFGESTLLELFFETVRSRRDPARRRFRAQVRSLVDRIDEMLQNDDRHGPGGASAAALRSTLGGGQRFVDPDALSRSLPAYRGSERIDAERRTRLEWALSCLGRWLARIGDEPEIVLVGSTSAGGSAGVRHVRHPDGLRAAIGLFDGYARALGEVVRAVRTARLDVAGDYDPELHDRLIASIETRAFSLDEMLQLPAIVVLDSARRVATEGLASFSTLLRSGRPVLVLLSEETGRRGSDSGTELGYDPGLGYLAIAHREALVLQSTMARPGHLTQGIARMAETHRPSVAVVLQPHGRSPLAPWIQLRFAWFGRGTPSFLYDPLAGPSWAERFSLADNPEPDAVWPECGTEVRDAAGTVTRLEQRFTAAHAAVAEPFGRPHAMILDTDDWAKDQVEIDAYLDSTDDQQRHRIPYLWIVRRDGSVARAILTREIACLAGDRKRAWRVLQELAGYHNEHALRAAAVARDEALAEAREQREALVADQEAALARVRAEAAGETIDRLVAVLMDLDAVAPPAGARPLIEERAEPVGPVETGEERAAPEAEESEQPAAEELSFDDPYIDAVLCTTCNECTNLNPRMFVYNENRQAQIADPASGTFEQLVKAAEKCPARCIHPGAPRSGDSTVNEDLLKRAKVFS